MHGPMERNQGRVMLCQLWNAKRLIYLMPQFTRRSKPASMSTQCHSHHSHAMGAVNIEQRQTLKN
jgi:hypothetical protein